MPLKTNIDGVTEFRDSKGNPSNILVANPNTGGCAWVAPMDCDMTLAEIKAMQIPENFSCLGYISEDGVKITEDHKGDDLRTFGGSVVRTIFSDYTLTLGVSFLEYYRPEVQAIVRGKGNVSWEDDGENLEMVIKHNSRRRSRFQFIFDMIDGELGDNGHVRLWLPNCMVTDISDTTFSHSDATVIEATLTVYPHTCSGVNMYEIDSRTNAVLECKCPER